jgi:hypothetical protein
MSDENQESCNPEACAGCTGCSGNSIDKISIRVEWRHNGVTPEKPDEILSIINELSSDLLVSGVELIYINNNFDKSIPENSSEFRINQKSLASLVNLPFTGPITAELLRKGIFQALLCNI